MQRIFTVVLIAAVPLVLFFFLSERGQVFLSGVFGDEQALIEINGRPMRVDVLDTAGERKRGLSGVRSLKPHSGVLFIFDDSDYHGIWMKDMRMSIDIIWINESFEIVHIESNVHPDTYPTVFEPDHPARFVIETSSRYTDSFGIEEGDRVKVPERFIPTDLQQ